MCSEASCIEKRSGGRGAGSDHYWVDPCVNYAFSNYSKYGLGCDRTHRGNGFANFYSPAMQIMLSDPRTCPKELLLFFHNVGWNQAMPTSANATAPLLQVIADGHRKGVQDASLLARDWDQLEGLVDEVRFKGVQARFKQQVNDAAVFMKVILGFYYNISGVRWDAEAR